MNAVASARIAQTAVVVELIVAIPGYVVTVYVQKIKLKVDIPSAVAVEGFSAAACKRLGSQLLYCRLEFCIRGVNGWHYVDRDGVRSDGAKRRSAEKYCKGGHKAQRCKEQARAGAFGLS